MTTSPKKAIQRGSRRPRSRSREYVPGPASMRAVAIAMFVAGSSGPPSVTQIGLPQCAFLTAMATDPITSRGPSRLRNPKSESTPPPKLGATSQDGPWPPGPQPHALQPAAGAVQAVPSPPAEQRLRPVARHEPSDHHPQDQRRRITHAHRLPLSPSSVWPPSCVPSSALRQPSLTGSAPRRPYGLQAGLYFLATILEEGGQREPLAEVLGVLVGGEAGAVGGDLEEYVTWFPEVDGTEVVAVDLRRYTEPHDPDPLPPRRMLLDRKSVV